MDVSRYEKLRTTVRENFSEHTQQLVDEALTYAAAAVEGAAALALRGEEHPGALKDAVCSPGGSTIMGVNELENRAFRAAAMNAVAAAWKRTAELGR